MSLIEPSSSAELKAHYEAVRARLWKAQESLSPTGVESPLEPVVVVLSPLEELAAKLRRTDELLFGGRVSPGAVIKITAAYFAVDIKDVTRNCRMGDASRARHASIYIIRNICFTLVNNRLERLSWNRIAKHFNQDHATAFHAVEATTKRMRKDKEYAAAIDEIIELLRRYRPRTVS